MNEVPAIVANGYGDGRTVYVGCRLGRQGLAKSLTAMLGSMGLPDLAGDGRVLRVDAPTPRRRATSSSCSTAPMNR